MIGTIDSLVDHEMIRASVEEFVLNEVEPQAKEGDRTGRFNGNLFRRMAHNHWIGGTVPEEYGGAGADPVSTITILEELSKSDPAFALSFLAHDIIFVYNIYTHGTEQQRIKYLPKTISGEWLAGGAMTTPEAGMQLLNMKARARRENGCWILNGNYQTITNPQGDVFIVYAKTSDEHENMSAFVVESGFKGFTQGEIEKEKMGMRASTTGSLVLTDCEVPLENIIGEEGRAFGKLMENLSFERLGLTAISTGIALRCIYEMTNYAKDRKPDGKTPLKEYGQIKERIADSISKTQNARAYLYQAAGMVGKKSRISFDADSSKLFGQEVGVSVADHAMRVFGGPGYCGSVPERMLRDAYLLVIGGGTAEALQNGIVSEFYRGNTNDLPIFRPRK